ncbi:10486_t:CDS:2 [Scutellospora calospora]|uniref:10486_t:CDS:1 n=1 Tax=Scutellospora calospora TaxID=85575 RepID=A0ACA9K9V6_9GLOM|nr:10486_t:CDS:2 [Scutellospora calospora]
MAVIIVSNSLAKFGMPYNLKHNVSSIREAKSDINQNVPLRD